MFRRDWWKRHFGNVLAAPIKRDEFEHCTACGQPFNSRDLDQVLPHFEHRLALAPRPGKESSAAEELRSPGGKVVERPNRAAPALWSANMQIARQRSTS